MARTATDGILNVDKPSGVTSRQVVDQIRRRLGIRRAGHAGTLDPLATGVLLVCLGRATRLVEFLQELPKTYRASFLLGALSDTDDVDGQVEYLCRPPIPTAAQIEAGVASQVGTILQVPPAFSALHVAGERAYVRARRGESVELAARPVTIESIAIERYDYPELELTITCHSGTYIRAIGRDLAAELGTGAVMKQLERTAVGPFRVDQAAALDGSADELERAVQPPQSGLPHLPQVVLSTMQVAAVQQGQRVESLEAPHEAARLAAVDEAGKLVAILVPNPAGWQPRKVFRF